MSRNRVGKHVVSRIAVKIAQTRDASRLKSRLRYDLALSRKLPRDDRSWGGDDPPGVVFTYAPSRAGTHAETILHGFDGILQLDGYPGYNRLTRPSRKGGEPARVAHCWAHARRKLKEVFDRDGSPIAAEGLRRIAESRLKSVALIPANASLRGKHALRRWWRRSATG